jgi:dolichol-phosphate mannosyltransferase
MRVLVVVPTYCEAENIEQFLGTLRDSVPDADVLVVDDSSPDGTAQLAEKLGEKLGRIDVLSRGAKGGLGAAYRAGFQVGIDRGYDVLVEMDADLSHDPLVLPTLLQALENGADLAIGSRYAPGGSIENWPVFRSALSRWGNRYTAFVLGLPVADSTAGYRAYRADALRQADFAATQATGYAFQIELAYRVFRNSGKVVEIPIVFTDRVSGESKMSLRIAVEAITIVTGWALRDRVFRRGRPEVTEPEPGPGLEPEPGPGLEPGPEQEPDTRTSP